MGNKPSMTPGIAMLMGAAAILGAAKPASFDNAYLSRRDRRKLPHFQQGKRGQKVRPQR
jgi:hypothetical protein